MLLFLIKKGSSTLTNVRKDVNSNDQNLRLFVSQRVLNFTVRCPSKRISQSPLTRTVGPATDLDSYQKRERERERERGGCSCSLKTLIQLRITYARFADFNGQKKMARSKDLFVLLRNFSTFQRVANFI